jgi:hypothetical protein
MEWTSTFPPDSAKAASLACLDALIGPVWDTSRCVYNLGNQRVFSKGSHSQICAELDRVGTIPDVSVFARDDGATAVLGTHDHSVVTMRGKGGKSQLSLP